MIFFNDCNTADKLKREYHRLSHLLHPDTADTKSLFIMMKNEYERMEKTINNQFQDRVDHLVADIRLEMTKLDKLDLILVESILDDPKLNGYFVVLSDNILPAKITSLLREYVKLKLHK